MNYKKFKCLYFTLNLSHCESAFIVSIDEGHIRRKVLHSCLVVADFTVDRLLGEPTLSFFHSTLRLHTHKPVVEVIPYKIPGGCLQRECNLTNA